MSDFYRTKETMTAEHKKHMESLKKTYDNSLLSLKREEAEAIERVSKANAEAVKVEKDLAERTKHVSELSARASKATEDIAKARNELLAIKTRIESEGKTISDTASKIKALEDESALKTQNRLEALARENDRIEALSAEVETKSVSTERLAKIAQETYNKALALSEATSRKENELDALKEKCLNDMNKINAEKSAINKLKEQVTATTLQAETMIKTSEERQIANHRRSLELDAIEKRQNDRQIDLDHRDMELNQLQSKVTKIIELNKVKV